MPSIPVCVYIAKRHEPAIVNAWAVWLWVTFIHTVLENCLFDDEVVDT